MKYLVTEDRVLSTGLNKGQLLLSAGLLERRGEDCWAFRRNHFEKWHVHPMRFVAEAEFTDKEKLKLIGEAVWEHFPNHRILRDD